MTDLQTVRGFEDLWRSPARDRRRPDRPVLPSMRPVLHSGTASGTDAKARLARVVQRAPEVMVKITGKTKSGDHLQAHLAYISRDGALALEGPDGERLQGLKEVAELGSDWSQDDARKREDASLSVSIMLSMPAGTDARKVRDAVRQFAVETFKDRFDYVFALHTDVDHPHVHMAVRSLGEGGERLNPRKADLDAWRQTFARTLRDRGIAAEATPRRTRGIVRKPEAMPVRKLRERYEREVRDRREADPPPIPPWTLEAAAREARAIADGRMKLARPWEGPIIKRQRAVRAAYVEAAKALSASADPGDRILARAVAAFVKAMPPPVTRRNVLVRVYRASKEPEVQPATPEQETPTRAGPDRDRGRTPPK